MYAVRLEMFGGWVSLEVGGWRSTHIFPAESGFAAFAIDVGNCMETGEQYSFFRRPAAHVHTVQTKQLGHAR